MEKINDNDKEKGKAYLGLVLVFMIWGSLYVVSQAVLKSIPTFLLMFCRFGVAFMALSCILKVKGRRWNGGKSEQGRRTKLDRSAWKYVILMGTCGYAISVSVQLLGIRFAGSSMASLINSLNPVTISLIAVPILHEKLTRNKIIGILLAVIGVYMILGSGGQVSIPGVLFSLLSVFSWSLIAVLTRQGLAMYEPIVVTRAAVGIAAVCELAFVAVEFVILRPAVHFSPAVIAGILYLGVICTGLAYVIWNGALVTLPASNCSALYPIQPLTSTLMGILFFHEMISVNFIIGTVCIICGVLICLLGGALFADRKRTGV